MSRITRRCWSVSACVLSLLALTMLALTMLAGDAAAARGCVRYQDHLRLVGGAPVEGIARDVTAVGDLAYVAVDRQWPSTGQLQIVDVGDPAAPQTLGVVDFAWPAFGVAVAGDLAFVAAREGGLVIVSVADPSAPVVLGVADTPSMAYGVAVTGHHALVASYDAGLIVIDVADPAAPAAVATVILDDAAKDVEIAGTHAFVAADFAGVAVVDIADPAAPTVATVYSAGGRARNLTLAGDRAYVANNVAGLQVLDIADPLAPQVLGALDMQQAFDVALDGTVAYLAAYYSLYTVDVSDPAAMQILGEVGTGGSAFGVVAHDSHALVAATGAGLQVVDAGNPESPDLLSLTTTPYADGGAYVAYADGFAYLTWAYCEFTGDCHAGLQVFDLADPAAPRLVAELPLAPGAGAVDLVGSALFIAGGDGLLVVDVSDPLQPALAGTVPELDFAQDVLLAGARAYVAREASIHVLDITVPSQPTELGSVILPADPLHLASAGEHLHAAAGTSGLVIVDVGDPHAPAILGTVETTGYARCVAVAADHAYLTNTGRVDVVTIADPAFPVVLDSIDLPTTFAYDLTVLDRTLYVAGMGSGLQVFALSVPAAPAYLGSVSTGDYLHRLAATGDQLLLANQDRLAVAPLQCDPLAVPPPPPSALRLAVAPNPFNPRTTVSFELPLAAEVGISIYDLRGRRVAELARGRWQAGAHRVTWDGRDTAGRSVASGTYLVRLRAGQRLATRKILLAR